jgi:NADH-quinone oxidoreductase subunit N
MYFDEPTDTSTIGGSMLMRVILSVNALLVFVLGISPGGLLQICARALQ